MRQDSWMGRAPGVGTVDAENPWPGLAAFREADHAFFRGRDIVVDELARLVLRTPVTVLFGVSGLGKTSLLRAGLFPVLRQNALLPVYIRLHHANDERSLRQQVFDALSQAAATAGVESVAPDSGVSLWEHLHRKDVRFWNERNRLVTPLLVFDQFEEIFTVGTASADRRERSETFVAELADLVEARPPAAVKARLEEHPEEAIRFSLTDRPCKVLISLREDFLAEITELAARMPSIAQQTYRLQRMNQDEALRVVQVEGLVPPDVARRVVEFVAAPESGAAADPTLPVEPALLSVFCRELNHKRRAQGRATIAADLVEGNARTIIADFYERTVSDPRLGPGVRRLVEEKLLTPSGFRNSLAEEEALLEPGVSAEDLDRLIELRLLRREETGTRAHARIELTHDRLTEPIRVSRDRRRMREQEEQKLSALRAVELEAQKRADEARRRRFTMVLGLAGAVAVVLALVAVYQRRAADEQRAEARRALAAADVERVLLGEPEPLPYLARAVANDPEDDLPRAVLFRHLATAITPVASVDTPGGATWADFSAGGRDVVTVGEDGLLRLWSWEGGSYATQPRVPAFATHGACERVQVAPDGSRAAVVTLEGALHLWSPAVQIELLPAGHQITATQFDADGTRVLALADGELHVWDAHTGRSAATGLDGRGEIAAAAFDDAGAVLAVVVSPEVRVLNAASGARVGPDDAPLAHEDVRSGVFAFSRGAFALVSRDNVVRLWDAASGSPRGGRMPHERPVTQCAFSPDGSWLLTVADEAVRLWDANTGDPLGWPVHHHGPISSAGFSADGAFVVTASADGAVRVWDARRAAVASTPLVHPGDAGVTGMDFSSDGERLLTVAADGVVRLWDASSGTIRATLAPSDPALATPIDLIDAATFSEDGRIVTKGGRFVGLWDAAGKPLTVVSALSAPADADSVSWIVTAGSTRSGDEVLTLASDGTTSLWDARHGRLARAFSTSVVPHPTPGAAVVNLAAFDPARMLLAAAGGRHVAIWNVETGTPVGRTMSHQQIVNSVEFHPGGSHLVTASFDGTARLWNVATGELAGELRHENQVTHAAFSDSGEEVITTTRNGPVRVWDVRGALDDDPTTVDRGLTLKADDVRGAVISHGRVFTGTRDGRIVAWSARTGAPIGSPLRDDPGIAAIAVSRDGSRIATVATRSALDTIGGSIARIWAVPVGEPADAEMLRRLAEGVRGHRLRTDGVLVALSTEEQRDVIEDVRDRWGDGNDLAGRFVRWFLADPSDRAVSPLSTVTASRGRAPAPGTRREAEAGAAGNGIDATRTASVPRTIADGPVHRAPPGR